MLVGSFGFSGSWWRLLSGAGFFVQFFRRFLYNPRSGFNNVVLLALLCFAVGAGFGTALCRAVG